MQKRLEEGQVGAVARTQEGSVHAGTSVTLTHVALDVCATQTSIWPLDHRRGVSLMFPVDCQLHCDKDPGR